MKAVVFHEYGGPEVLRYEDVDEPRLGAEMVRIKVGATTLNHGLDLMVREGRFGVSGFNLPHVGGSDAAGEIVELGSAAKGFTVGERVVAYSVLSCGTCDMCRSGLGENFCRRLEMFGVHCWGGHAQLAVVPARNLSRLPDNVSYEAAATLPVAYVTAWNGLVVRAAVGPHDTVLVMGAGSGIGAAAIQICKLRGARVFATTGAEWKHRRALEIGAEAVFDYRDSSWPQRLLDATDGLGVTLLFDNIAGRVWNQSLVCLGRGGRLVSSGATAGHLVELDVRRLYRDQITCLFNANGSKSDLEELIQLVGQGVIDPVIDSQYPIHDAVAANQRLTAHEQFGKIVLAAEPVKPSALAQR